MTQIKYYYRQAEEGKEVFCKIDHAEDRITEIGFTLSGNYRSVRGCYPQLVQDIETKMEEVSALAYHQALISVVQPLTNELHNNVSAMRDALKAGS